MSKASIYHCEQCGALLATREELIEGMCLTCQFDREWRDMLNRQSQVPARLLASENEHVGVARGNLNDALTSIQRRIRQKRGV